MNMGIDIGLGGGKKRNRLRCGNQFPRKGRGTGHSGRAIVECSESMNGNFIDFTLGLQLSKRRFAMRLSQDETTPFAGAKGTLQTR